MYSAIKKDGVPLYKLARKGQSIEREGREVNIQKIELLQFTSPYVEIKVHCSKGTYIRTLVDDIGEKLQTLAHVVELRRTASGIFDIAQAVPLDDTTSTESISDKCLSIEDVIKKIIPTLKVPRELAIRVANGFQLSYNDLMSLTGDKNKWGSADNVALLADTASGEQKILAILKIIPQDFEELINMNSSSKIAKTLRIFHNEEWRK
jgi:tRNA pseudouridine55 synthase